MTQKLAIGGGRRTPWVGALLVALAILVRMWTPEGWMPGTGGALTLCTAHGAQLIYVPGVPPSDDQRKASSHAPCAFAGVGALISGPPPVALAAALAFLLALGLCIRTDSPVAGSACARRQVPRAPPRHS